MPSDQCNSIMAIATGFFLLLNVALFQDVPFHGHKNGLHKSLVESV